MADTPDSSAPAKKASRGPFGWVLLVLVLITLGFLLSGGTGFQRIDTAQGMQLLEDGKVDQAQIVDGDQRVDLVLTEDFEFAGKEYGNKVQFFYVEQRGDEIVEAVVAAEPPGGFTDDVPQQSWVTTLLLNLLPFIIILAIFVPLSIRTYQRTVLR